MSEPTAQDVEPTIGAALPEFIDATREDGLWTIVDDPDSGYVSRMMLSDLRSWLLDRSLRRDRAVVARAWATVEQLAQTEDPDLLNALMVGLLEGHWPTGHHAVMGPRTKELYARVMDG
jgi:hypothetical protein